jgi:hypothetical protein
MTASMATGFSDLLVGFASFGAKSALSMDLKLKGSFRFGITALTFGAKKGFSFFTGAEVLPTLVSLDLSCWRQ